MRVARNSLTNFHRPAARAAGEELANLVLFERSPHSLLFVHRPVLENNYTVPGYVVNTKIAWT